MIRTPPLATLTVPLVEKLEREINERGSCASGPIHLHLRLRGMIPVDAMQALYRLISIIQQRLEGLFTLESHPHTYCQQGSWLAKLFCHTTNLKQASCMLPAKPVEVDMVMEALQPSMNSLEFLHLVKGTYNSQESPVPAIARYISNCTRLQHLDLNFISLAAPDAAILIPAIIDLVAKQAEEYTKEGQQENPWPGLNFLAITSGHIQDHSMSSESLLLLTQLVRALHPMTSWKVTKTGGSLFPDIDDPELARESASQAFLAAMYDHPPCEIVERKATPYLATHMLRISERMKPGGPDHICALALHGVNIMNPPLSSQSTDSWTQLLESLPRMQHLTGLVILSFGRDIQMKSESDESRRNRLRQALYRNTSLSLASFGVFLKPPRSIFDRNIMLARVNSFLRQSTESPALLPYVMAATGAKNPTPDAVFCILRAQQEVIQPVALADQERSNNDSQTEHKGDQVLLPHGTQNEIKAESKLASDDDWTKVTSKDKKRVMRKGRGKKGRLTVAHSTSSGQAITSNETLQQELDSCRDAISKTAFFQQCFNMLANQRNVHAEKQHWRSILCLGVGNFAKSNRNDFSASLHQLAFIVLLRQKLEEETPIQIDFFDPECSDFEQAFLRSKGIQILSKDKSGGYEITANTICYMPHAPYNLYENIVRVNSEKFLKSPGPCIIGNSLSNYCHSLQIKNDIPVLQSLKAHIVQLDLPKVSPDDAPGNFVEAFNDTYVTTFSERAQGFQDAVLETKAQR